MAADVQLSEVPDSYMALRSLRQAVAEATDNRFRFRFSQLVKSCRACRLSTRFPVAASKCATRRILILLARSTFAFGTALPIRSQPAYDRCWMFSGGGMELMNDLYKNTQDDY